MKAKLTRASFSHYICVSELCIHYRKNFKKALDSILTIQKNYRAHFYRRQFQRKSSAALVLQKHRRGQVARGVCRKLREEKRKKEEEERKKKEEEEKKTKGDHEKNNEEEKEEEKAEVSDFSIPFKSS